jgi:hypothetical protein
VEWVGSRQADTRVSDRNVRNGDQGVSGTRCETGRILGFLTNAVLHTRGELAIEAVPGLGAAGAVAIVAGAGADALLPPAKTRLTIQRELRALLTRAADCSDQPLHCAALLGTFGWRQLWQTS